MAAKSSTEENASCVFYNSNP